MKPNKIFILFLIFIFPVVSKCTVWQVEPVHTYKHPNAVNGLVNDGDTIEIDTSIYTGSDACATWYANGLWKWNCSVICSINPLLLIPDKRYIGY